MYEFTYNEPNFFSTTQNSILLKLPNEDDLHQFRPTKVLAAPVSMKDVEFDEEKSLVEYLLST